MWSNLGFWSIRVFGDRIVIPHSLGFKEGGVWDVPPFRILDTRDPSLASQLTDILADRTNLRIAEDASAESRDDPQLLRALGAKSWGRYYSVGREWSVEMEGGTYNIIPWAKPETGQGFVIDSIQRENLKGLNVRQVVEYLVSRIAELSP